MGGHLVLRGERGQATQGDDASAADGLVQALAICRHLRAIIPRVPKMKHTGGKSAVFATHTGPHQTYRQIGILKAPADKGIVEAIDEIEVAACDGEVASLCAAPTFFVQLPQWPKRQMQRRQQAIDAAAQALAHQGTEAPRLW